MLDDWIKVEEYRWYFDRHGRLVPKTLAQRRLTLSNLSDVDSTLAVISRSQIDAPIAAAGGVDRVLLLPVRPHPALLHHHARAGRLSRRDGWAGIHPHQGETLPLKLRPHAIPLIVSSASLVSTVL